MRAVRGISTMMLASQVGVTQSYLYQLEGGRANPSVDVVRALCTILNCTSDALLWGEAC